MDDKVKDIMQKVRAAAGAAGEAAGRAAEAAGKKAGEMFEVAKLNVQVYDLNMEIDGMFKRIGEILYSVHRGFEEDNDTVGELLEKIDEKTVEVQACKGRIESFKAVKNCKVCARVSSKDADYCSYCGAKLQ